MTRIVLACFFVLVGCTQQRNLVLTDEQRAVAAPFVSQYDSTRLVVVYDGDKVYFKNIPR